MSKKELLITGLKKYEIIERKNKNIFKAHAYAKAIKGISQLLYVNSIDDIEGITGIGESIRTKCEHILQSQTEIDKETTSIELLQHVYGIGPVKAHELVTNYKIRSLAQLRKRIELLTPIQQIGLKYVEDSMKRIPREEMDKHARQLHSLLKSSTKSKLMGCIVGSYRRKKESSGDIDMLLTYTKDLANPCSLFETFVKECVQSEYIVDIVANGKKKCMAFCKLKGDHSVRRLDLLLTPPEEFVTSLLYFTGSQEFNIKVRSHALELGYTLNEHSLTPLREDVVKPPLFIKEKDLFDFLQLEYVAPENR